MRTLAIETSCDETAIAILETEPRGETLPTQPLNTNSQVLGGGGVASDSLSFRILANKTVSQVALHREYGGVFPMLAKREHARTLVPLLVTALKEAGLYKETSRHVIEHPLRADFQEILDREPGLFAEFISVVPYLDPPELDRIAVTTGPGLEPALWTGINFAKALAMIWKIPVVPVDHMEGHIFAAFLENADDTHVRLPKIEFPALALLVSGGHTELVLVDGWSSYKVLGATRDDAVGEAFDKVARLLGLPYPGGPEIAKLAASGTPNVHSLPRPMLHSKDYDFSFAGLKTAVLYLIKKIGILDDKTKADIAREFQDACVEVLTEKTMRAVEEFAPQALLVGGGVSANKELRTVLAKKVLARAPHVGLYFPAPTHATDNALMIAIAGAMWNKDTFPALSELKAEGHKKLDS